MTSLKWEMDDYYKILHVTSKKWTIIWLSLYMSPTYFREARFGVGIDGPIVVYGRSMTAPLRHFSVCPMVGSNDLSQALGG